MLNGPRSNFSGDAALHYAEIRAHLKKRGALIGANDLLIAAHARALGLTLVTNNTAEFERVGDLVIENWTTPARREKEALDLRIDTAGFPARIPSAFLSGPYNPADFGSHTRHTARRLRSHRPELPAP